MILVKAVVELHVFATQLGVRVDDVGVHAVEHLLDEGANLKVDRVEAELADHREDVVELAQVERGQNVIGDLMVGKDLAHFTRAVEGDVEILQETRSRGVGLAVEVIGLGHPNDARSRNERLDEEGIIGPASPFRLDEPDALLLQEGTAVDGRPDGGMVAEDLRIFIERERMRRFGHATGDVRLANLLFEPVAPIEILPVRALHHIGGTVYVRVPVQVAVHIGVDEIIGFDDGDVLAGRMRKAVVEGMAVASVGLVEHLEARVHIRELLHGRKRIVLASVVHAEHFDIFERLHPNALEAGLEIGAGVVDGKNH